MPQRRSKIRVPQLRPCAASERKKESQNCKALNTLWLWLKGHALRVQPRLNSQSMSLQSCSESSAKVEGKVNVEEKKTSWEWIRPWHKGSLGKAVTRTENRRNKSKKGHEVTQTVTRPLYWRCRISWGVVGNTLGWLKLSEAKLWRAGVLGWVI